MLLQQFKDSFINVQDQGNSRQGQMDYDQTAHDLLCELPFMKKHHLGQSGELENDNKCNDE